MIQLICVSRAWFPPCIDNLFKSKERSQDHSLSLFWYLSPFFSLIIYKDKKNYYTSKQIKRNNQKYKTNTKLHTLFTWIKYAWLKCCIQNQGLIPINSINGNPFLNFTTSVCLTINQRDLIDKEKNSVKLVTVFSIINC